MGKLQVVVGGQYGSEGKGAVAGFLSQQTGGRGFVGVRVAGPNAGHTAWAEVPTARTSTRGSCAQFQ